MTKVQAFKPMIGPRRAAEGVSGMVRGMVLAFGEL
jgi:hypothetical protein